VFTEAGPRSTIGVIAIAALVVMGGFWAFRRSAKLRGSVGGVEGRE
jgi:hypothetical protein